MNANAKERITVNVFDKKGKVLKQSKIYLSPDKMGTDLMNTLQSELIAVATEHIKKGRELPDKCEGFIDMGDEHKDNQQYFSLGTASISDQELFLKIANHKKEMVDSARQKTEKSEKLLKFPKSKKQKRISELEQKYAALAREAFAGIEAKI